MWHKLMPLSVGTGSASSSWLPKRFAMITTVHEHPKIPRHGIVMIYEITNNNKRRLFFKIY